MPTYTRDAAVERAALIMADLSMSPTMVGHVTPGTALQFAYALADAGIIRAGDTETRTEYGVRYRDGTVKYYGDQEWVRTGQALADDWPNAVATMQRTVTTHTSEWTEVPNDV